MKEIIAILLISVTLFISGCGEPEVSPQPCVKIYPKLPTYKVPPLQHMKEPKAIGGGLYVVDGSELRDCLLVNRKLRKICSNYAVINKKVNEEYNK